VVTLGELAEALHATAAAVVVISGYPSQLYDREPYPDWSRVEIASMTGNGGRDRARTEVIWSNRPIGRHPTLLDLFDNGAYSGPSSCKPAE
jgi:DNA adenine methylase